MGQMHPGGTLKIESASDLVVPGHDTSRLQEELTELSDDSLLGLVRGGSADAYAVLIERHRRPAHRLAAYYSNSIEAEDIVAECFAQLYDLLHRGESPQVSFRAYLFTSLRHEASRRATTRKRASFTDDVVRKPHGSRESENQSDPLSPHERQMGPMVRISG